MSADMHQRARELAMAARVEGIGERERLWLEAHLAECAGCADAHAALDAAIGALRAPSVMADSGLVRATQARVRMRAAELRQHAATMRPLWIATALVVAYALVTTAAAWQIFGLAGEWLRLTAMSSRLVFAVVWIAPAIGASLLLLACGSHRARWSVFTEISER